MANLASLLVAASLMVASLPAHAVVKLDATRKLMFSFSNETFVLPLNDIGETQLKFNLPEAKTLLLTFSANCTVTGTNQNVYAHIDIFVNGSTVVPTQYEGDPFCGWSSYLLSRETITLAIKGKKGVNTIQVVIGRKNAASGTATLVGYSSLVVSD